MEIILEILFVLLEFIAEIVLQVLLEAFGEFGLRRVSGTFGRLKPANPIMAAISYAVFGSVSGVLSLLLFPELFITRNWMRVMNLIVSPAIAGGFMVALGAWRRRRGQELIRLDRFSYGFLFAFAMALVRYFGAQ